MSFYCLELSEKQLLQAPNADALILNGCFSCASSKVDDIITLGFILEQQNFSRLHRHFVWFILR